MATASPAIARAHSTSATMRSWVAFFLDSAVGFQVSVSAAFFAGFFAADFLSAAGAVISGFPPDACGWGKRIDNRHPRSSQPGDAAAAGIRADVGWADAPTARPDLVDRR